jgi:hypothetical protein
LGGLIPYPINIKGASEAFRMLLLQCLFFIVSDPNILPVNYTLKIGFLAIAMSTASSHVVEFIFAKWPCAGLLQFVDDFYSINFM